MGKQTGKKSEIVIEEQLVKRDGVQQRLADVRGAIAEAFKEQKEKQQILDEADRDLGFFCRESGIEQNSRCLKLDGSCTIDLSSAFSTDRLNDQEKERLEQLENNMKNAAAESRATDARLEDLRQEEEALMLELLDPETVVEETILFRTRLSDAVKKVTGIREQIALQEEAIDTTRAGLPSLDELNRKREDLLAEIATGNASENQLSELDSLIESEKEKASEALKGAETIIEHARQTIAGLSRKLTKAEDELAMLELNDKAVVSRFLRIEAEKAGSDYARLAKALVGKFRQLVALGKIMHARGLASIGEDNLRHFAIPRFMLNVHDQAGSEGWYFDGNPVLLNLQRLGINENDMDAEIRRIASMGINI